MKKTLATLLVVALVASLCGVMFVSAESVNLAAGKSYTTTAIFTTDGVQNWPDEGGVTLTDGVKAAADAGYADAVWTGFNKQSSDYDASENGNGAVVVIDLGAVCELDKIAYQACKDTGVGITVPYWANLYTSVDGENYELAGYIEQNADEAPAGVNQFECDVDVSARYVKVCLYMYGWVFIDEIEVLGTAPAAEGGDEPDAPAEHKTWENTLVENEEGNYSCEVPYGYTWTVNYVDGTIAGEDVTVCTTQEAYNACNPNWAISVVLEKQADGTYVAAADAIITPGGTDKVTLGENQIVLVAHSAYSNPQGTNWQGKVVAMSVKAGDVFTVSEDYTTVYAVDPNAPAEDATPGDAGILVFAVLAVVAIAGCAVATKIKSSAY